MPADRQDERTRFNWTRWPSGRRLAATVMVLSVFLAAMVGWWMLGGADYSVVRAGSLAQLRPLQTLLLEVLSEFQVQ